VGQTAYFTQAETELKSFGYCDVNPAIDFESPIKSGFFF
jgi:hypothetical protein